MDNQEFKFERTVLIGTVIVVVLILFSMLSFFGIINLNDLNKEYCEVPTGFSCDNIYIGKDVVQFTLTNEGEDKSNIVIQADAEHCDAFGTDRLNRKKPIQVKISCLETAAPEKSFKTKLTFYYEKEFDFQTTEEEGIIKGIVK